MISITPTKFNSYNYHCKNKPSVEFRNETVGNSCMSNLNGLYGRVLVSFKSNQTKQSFDIDDFYSVYKYYYKQTPISETVSNAAIDRNNYINQGSTNVTFNIPNIDKYVIRMPIKVWENIENINIDELKQIKDYYPDLNFGQPIMENNQKVQICKKQLGEPIVICDWFKYKEDPSIVNHEISYKFLENMETLSEFPIDSFRELANSLRKIDKHSIDYLNSNNFLIDKNNKKVCRVDVTDILSNSINPLTKENLIFPLLNSFMLPYFREALTNDERLRLDNAARKIIQKCNIVSKEFSLDSDKNYPYDFWENRTRAYLGDEMMKEFKKDVNKTITLYYDDIYDVD